MLAFPLEIARRSRAEQAVFIRGYSFSPARTGTASLLPGGASGHTQRGSYEHDGL